MGGLNRKSYQNILNQIIRNHGILYFQLGIRFLLKFIIFFHSVKKYIIPYGQEKVKNFKQYKGLSGPCISGLK